MAKLTLIIGNPGTGKTTKALEIIGERKYQTLIGVSGIHHQEKRKHFGKGTENLDIYSIDKDTEVILLEDLSRDHMTELKMLSSIKVLRFRKPYEEHATEIKVPEIIVTSNSITKKDVAEARHFEVIQM